MWGSVALLALPIALDPVRLGVNLLLISRPRPARNLFVYWIGCVTASVVLLLVPLLVLHATPMFSSFVHDLANPDTSASATVRHVEVGAGVLVLAVAAVLAVRFVIRRRRPPEPDSVDSSPFTRLLQRGGRIRDAWDSGASWVAFAIGFWAGPNPSLVVFSLTTIVASGAPLGAQVAAAVVFIVVSLAIVEAVLICNVVAPNGTRDALRRVHDWVGGYRTPILAAILTVVGVAFMVQGTS